MLTRCMLPQHDTIRPASAAAAAAAAAAATAAYLSIRLADTLFANGRSLCLCHSVLRAK
jgi:hypothetical protein